MKLLTVKGRINNPVQQEIVLIKGEKFAKLKLLTPKELPILISLYDLEEYSKDIIYEVAGQLHTIRGAQRAMVYVFVAMCVKPTEDKKGSDVVEFTLPVRSIGKKVNPESHGGNALLPVGCTVVSPFGARVSVNVALIGQDARRLSDTKFTKVEGKGRLRTYKNTIEIISVENSISVK